RRVDLRRGHVPRGRSGRGLPDGVPAGLHQEEQPRLARQPRARLASHPGARRREKKPALAKETSAALVPYLAHPVGWWRDTAQQLLVQRADRSVVPALKDLLHTAPDWRAHHP